MSSGGAAHVREMTLRIPTPDASTVDVQVNQRQGQVLVAVRTADEGLQASLRQDLPQLVTSLDRAGFHAETFVPRAPEGGTAAAESLSGKSLQDSANDPSQDAPQDPGRGSSRREHGPPNQNPQQQNQQQRPREQRRLRWLDQMED
jgi:hypothetical protein